MRGDVVCESREGEREDDARGQPALRLCKHVDHFTSFIDCIMNSSLSFSVSISLCLFLSSLIAVSEDATSSPSNRYQGNRVSHLLCVCVFLRSSEYVLVLDLDGEREQYEGGGF